MLLILASCNSATLSIKELESVPKDIQNKLNSSNTLEMIYTKKNISYIVFRSKGNVLADVEIQGDKLLIKLDVTDEQDDGIKQHIYKLTYDYELVEYINVLINGEPTPFDQISG